MPVGVQCEFGFPVTPGHFEVGFVVAVWVAHWLVIAVSQSPGSSGCRLCPKAPIIALDANEPAVVAPPVLWYCGTGIL
jgi:hypothetical protein